VTSIGTFSALAKVVRGRRLSNVRGEEVSFVARAEPWQSYGICAKLGLPNVAKRVSYGIQSGGLRFVLRPNEVFWAGKRFRPARSDMHHHLAEGVKSPFGWVQARR
jgi:hypothetical protein